MFNLFKGNSEKKVKNKLNEIDSEIVDHDLSIISSKHRINMLKEMKEYLKAREAQVPIKEVQDLGEPLSNTLMAPSTVTN